MKKRDILEGEVELEKTYVFLLEEIYSYSVPDKKTIRRLPVFLWFEI